MGLEESTAQMGRRNCEENTAQMGREESMAQRGREESSTWMGREECEESMVRMGHDCMAVKLRKLFDDELHLTSDLILRYPSHEAIWYHRCV